MITYPEIDGAVFVSLSQNECVELFRPAAEGSMLRKACGADAELADGLLVFVCFMNQEGMIVLVKDRKRVEAILRRAGPGSQTDEEFLAAIAMKSAPTEAIPQPQMNPA
jgi:hypothetical protein